MKFKVGDKVAVYDRTYNLARGVGKVVEIDDHPATGVRVRVPNYQDFWFHPKQCRRLVKKERRRMWVRFDQHGTVLSTSTRFPSGNPDYSMLNSELVEFVEVKKK